MTSADWRDLAVAILLLGVLAGFGGALLQWMLYGGSGDSGV